MEKKKVYGGLIAVMFTFASLAVAVSMNNGSAKNVFETQAVNEIYQLNTVNWEKEIVSENPTATGSVFNGIDGVHFVITECAGTTDWHIKMWNTTNLSLVASTQYKMRVDFDVVSLTGENKLNFITNGNNAEGLWTDVNYSQGYNQVHEATFTATDANPTLEIHFGKTPGAFEVVVKRIIISEAVSGNVVRRTYLESDGDFANRWKAANHELDLCDASDSDVKALLRSYADLLPWVRENFDAMSDTNHYDGSSSTTLGAEVAYFAARHNVSFE